VDSGAETGEGEEMREILFKGKRLDNGEWVEGYLFIIWARHFILWGTTNDVPNMIEINPSTLCQFTGLLDKDGAKIWEGDRVRIYGDEGCLETEHDEGVVEYCGAGDYPAFELKPSFDCDSNCLSYGMAMGGILRLGSIHDRI